MKKREKKGRRTAVLEAILLDGHLLRQLGQRLVDGVTPSQRLREPPLEALHLLHGALGEGRPEEQRSRGAVWMRCARSRDLELVNAVAILETFFGSLGFFTSTSTLLTSR